MKSVMSRPEGLLGWSLHCYIQECCLCSDQCHFTNRGNPGLSIHWSKVPALAFPTAVLEPHATFFNSVVELLGECILCATACGNCQVSTNTVSSGWVQRTVVCTNPKCLWSSVGLCSIILLCQTPMHKGMHVSYVFEKKLSTDYV